MPQALRLGIRVFSPYVVHDWPTWYKMITRDLSRTTLEAFFSSIGSLHKTDLRPQLPGITTPIMGIYGVGDRVVEPTQANVITNNAPLSRVLMMPGSGHFPMLDEPQAFNENLAEFLAFEFETLNGALKQNK